MIYPSGENVSFDANRFRDQHLGVLRTAYGDALERVELRMAPQAAEGAPSPPLLGAANLWIRDVSAFVTRANTHAKTVATDMAAVTNSAPMVQFDRVIASLGEDRLAIPVDTTCVSMYFPAKEGGTWDTKYYTDTYLPKLLAAYGPDAVRRIEAAEGAAGQGGAAPLLLSAIHVYVKDDAAYDLASQSPAVTELFAEAEKHTTVAPLLSLTKVHAFA